MSCKRLVHPTVVAEQQSAKLVTRHRRMHTTNSVGDPPNRVCYSQIPCETEQRLQHAFGAGELIAEARITLGSRIKSAAERFK
jgi:hypothetical protein